MGYRAGISRHQGSSFRHGHERSSHRRSATARQIVSPERLRHRSADAARRRRRKPRHGSSSKGQHNQTQNTFPVQTGLHALRVDIQHAGTPTAATDRALRRIHKSKHSAGADLRVRLKNEGMPEAYGLRERVALSLDISTVQNLLMGRSMRTPLVKFISNDSVATAIEYALMGSLLALVLVTVLTNLGTRLSTEFGEISGVVK